MAKLYFISEELVNFLGIEKNTQMSLGSILIIIRDYILKNNLQDKSTMIIQRRMTYLHILKVRH